MKKVFFLLCCALSAVPLSAQEKPILVTPSWLKEHLQDPKLIVVQVGSLEFDYAKEHITGARYLWPGWLAPDSPKGAMNAPDPKMAVEVLQQLGISNDSHVVLCHIRNEVSPTARIFLTLENLGMRGQVSFLNGGLEAWKNEGYEVTKVLPVVKKGKISLKVGTLLVDKDYVLRGVGAEAVVVVDARMQRYYDGEPTGNPRDGHIAGAKNIPYVELVDASNMFKPVDQLEGYFKPVVPDKQKEIVTYCFIGQTASVVYMAGRMLGYDMKLYDGSMQEWSRIEELPMEITKK